MAVDILETLIEILQISPTLVSEYAAQGPIYQLFYLFFFPIVFIILLIYVIMRRFSDNRGLSVLVGIAVLAFIILNGWYTFFAYLSRFWIFILVIIGFVLMWFYHKEKGPAEGGGGKGRVASATLGGIGQQIAGRLYRDISGQTKKIENEVRRGIKAIEASNNDVSFTEALATTERALSAYWEKVNVGGWEKGISKYHKLEKEVEKAIEKQRHKLGVKKIG